LALGILFVLGRTVHGKFAGASDQVAALPLAAAAPVAAVGAPAATAPVSLAAETPGTVAALQTSAAPTTGSYGTWAEYFRDIPRGAYNTATGDQRCKTLGCEAGRDLLTSIPFGGVGEAAEFRDLLATGAAWWRGEAYAGDVANQAMTFLLPAALGVGYRHYARGVQAGADAIVDQGRRWFGGAPRMNLVRPAQALDGVGADGLADLVAGVRGRTQLPNGLVVEPVELQYVARRVPGGRDVMGTEQAVRILPGPGRLGQEAARLEKLGTELWYAPNELARNGAGAGFTQRPHGQKSVLLVSSEDFRRNAVTLNTRHEIDHARVAAGNAKRGWVTPEDTPRIPIEAPVNAGSIAGYLRQGFAPDEIYTHARDVRRRVSLYHADPSPALREDIVKFTDKGRAFAHAQKEHAEKALDLLEAHPSRLEYRWQDDGLHGAVPVDGVVVEVRLGAHVQAYSDEAAALTRQRLQELRDDASVAADAFTRYRTELDRVPAHVVPDASRLHLSVRRLGPHNPLPPPSSR
jgi:hypothetical protein